MHIETFTVNMIEENCYLVYDDTCEAVIIDDGAYYDEEHKAIDTYIQANDLHLAHVLNTHGHFDHTFGNYHLYERYGLGTEMSEADVPLYEQLQLQMQLIIKHAFKAQSAPVKSTLKEGDTVKFGGSSLEVIATPGHTQGGLCFYLREQGVLFSGDTLFCRSVGRTDLQGGNGRQLIDSIREKLLLLPDDTVVLPGHGPQTTIGEEKRSNPYLN